jgi:hypothetical protein
MAPRSGAGLTGTPADGGHPVVVRPAGSRPDPTRLRVVLGAGGIAMLSALITAIVVPPAPAATAPLTAPAAPTTVTQQHPIQYVQLAPGQSPPPGAPVIDAKAPKPIMIVTRVPAPAQQTVVVRTTQSGKVIP